MSADRDQNDEGRLTARPQAPARVDRPGLRRLGLDPRRDGLVYVPMAHSPERPAPLVLMLHGAGGNGHNALGILQPLADAYGVVLLAPDARQQTWDAIRGGFGPDVAFIDRALEQVFSRCAVDPARIAIGGFSDGASYGLSLGLANGDLFSHVIAFSPGFAAPPGRRGRPGVFVTHGTDDAVLPIDACSRRVVPRLTRAGYAVDYREFAGPHTVPPAQARDAVKWFVRGASGAPRPPAPHPG
jgi:phospholipase/carboxylesterase